MKFACGWKKLRNWIKQPALGPDQTVLCVCGMHRSGTSMVSQLISRCGVYMGPEKVLTVSASDKQDGFWEDDALVKINDELLRHFSGAWDSPPMLQYGWEKSSALRALRRRGKNLIHERRSFPIWGWKDPRTSITLPFWKNLIPALKVVVCLRHPWEVARSLNRRNDMPMPAGLALWRAYQCSLLAATTPDDRIITHYDSHFADPAAEIARLADFLALPEAHTLANKLSTTCKDHLRNNRIENDPPESCLPQPIADLYSQMRAQAGPVYCAIKNECLCGATDGRGFTY
jgi:hypothetical protein